MITKVEAIFSLFLEQEIIMFLGVGQEPAIGLTTGLVVDPTEVGDHIHSIMQIFLTDRRAGSILMVGIISQEAEATVADFKEAGGVMA